jgi:hypothetical protein
MAFEYEPAGELTYNPRSGRMELVHRRQDQARRTRDLVGPDGQKFVDAQRRIDAKLRQRALEARDLRDRANSLYRTFGDEPDTVLRNRELHRAAALDRRADEILYPTLTRRT